MINGVALNLIGRRYVLEQALGSGGMGTVFRAKDRLTGGVVALKQVIQPGVGSGSTASLGNSRDERLALAQEFKVLASLRHPNIISVIDYGFDNQQQPYYTMELLENAQTIVEAGAGHSPADRIQLVSQMLQALAYLHRRDVIHRDLKPRNVLVVDEQVKVLDFGLSVTRDHVDDQSGGTTAGTLAYMAPEVLVGHPATEAADLYAVGIMAYELLVGRHPFNVQDMNQLINSILTIDPDIFTPDLDPRLAPVLGKLLAKAPENRYQTAAEVINDLNHSLDRPLTMETAATRESFLQAARLVGREAEVKRLSLALDQAVTGQGSAWLIAGESGVGKSRLLDEMRTLALVRGALVLRGQGIAAGSQSYSLWRPALRWLALITDPSDDEFAVLCNLMPDIAELLGRPAPPLDSLESRDAQARLLDVIEALFRRQLGPLVVILEDLQWADESLDVLRRLSEIARDLPLLTIASYRDDERPELPTRLPGMDFMKLDRLDQTGIAQLSEAMLGSNGRQPHVVELLQRETEGNVFFLIEVVRALAETTGQLDRIGMQTLPASLFVGGIQQVIQRRLSQVPPDDLPLLEIAAVMGRFLDIDLLRHLARGINLDRWLSTASDAAILEVQDDRWRFSHDKLREGVLNTLSLEKRQELHAQVARAIEAANTDRTPYAALLAYHYGSSGDALREAQYTELAGRQSLRTGAYREALTSFHRCLELVPVSHPNDTRTRPLTLKRLIAEAELGQGHYDIARALYRENLTDALGISDLPLMALSVGDLGDVAAAQQSYAEAQTYYREALALNRQMADVSATAHTLNRLATVLYEVGQEDEARRLFQQSLDLTRDSGESWGMAGSIRQTTTVPRVMASADHTALREMLLTGAQQPARDTLLAAYHRWHDNPDALTLLHESLKRFQAAGDRWGEALMLAWIGRVNLVSNQPIHAVPNLRHALEGASTLADDALMLTVLTSISRLLIAADLTGQAAETLSLILNHRAIDEATEAEAEQMAFELEQKLDPALMKTYWEQGKQRDLTALVAELLPMLE